MTEKNSFPTDADRKRRDRKRNKDKAIDDELTEALKGTFPGSDPVALESPLVTRTRARRDRARG